MSHGLRQRVCTSCGDPWEEPRKVGAPRQTCGGRLCIAVLRYRRKYGRWPPEVWFGRWALAAGLVTVKLPKKMKRIARGPPAQKDLFARGAA